MSVVLSSRGPLKKKWGGGGGKNGKNGKNFVFSFFLFFCSSKKNALIDSFD